MSRGGRASILNPKEAKGAHHQAVKMENLHGSVGIVMANGGLELVGHSALANGCGWPCLTRWLAAVGPAGAGGFGCRGATETETRSVGGVAGSMRIRGGAGGWGGGGAGTCRQNLKMVT